MKSDDRLRRGDYEVIRAREGFSSIRQISSGEIMHSRTEPIAEARGLYVEQSQLLERLRERSQEPLVVWDVGLGAAANAMAALDAYERSSPNRPLRLVSFENDLDPLRLALANLERFPYLRADAAEAIMTDSAWRSPDLPHLSWELFSGDFLERMNDAPTPDLIFYDMFSTKTSAPLWSASAFRKLFQACAGRAVELFTYTCSTANRAALLSADFFVARGRNAGEKIETTIALTPAALISTSKRNGSLLAHDWLARWERSAAKFPGDVAPNERLVFEKTVRDHEQFRN